MLAPSSRLGPYEILAPLGAGGMGEVYRARDTRLEREVAVKVLSAEFAGDPVRQARFEREARAVAALSHPNILAIHDYGIQDNVTYAVMELLDGETLRGRLSNGALPCREAIDLGVSIAEGLAAAHAKSIVHRDLKPENLFLTVDGRLKILDFGLAQVTPRLASGTETQAYDPAETMAGTVLGTVGYMSPEQVRGQPADARSDLFSFGCVFYEMVSGRRAFQRETAAETMTAILHDEPKIPAPAGPAIPAELSRVIRQCLAKHPNLRLQSARDVALALRASASEAHVDRRAVGRSRSWPLVGIYVSIFLAIIVAAAVFFRDRGTSPANSTLISTGTTAVDAIAVLPFVYHGRDPKTEMLAETLAEHIIDCLRQIGRPELKIRPPSSVLRFARQRPDTLTIGRELNVPLIVTGTMHQAGNVLRITVEVVDARDDSLIWRSEPYSATPGETLDLLIQDKMVEGVAANLGLRLSSEEQQRLTQRRTRDKEAYDLFRESLYHFHKFTLEGIDAGIAIGKKAIEKDPTFARAYATVGRCYLLRGTVYVGPKKSFMDARWYFEEALKLDADLPEAHTGLGAIYLFQDWNWSESERELRVALENDPNVILTRNILGFCLAAQGRLDEALASVTRGQELEPLSAARWHEIAMCHNAMGNFELAVAAAEKAIELDPNFWLAYGGLGTALTSLNRHEEAIEKLALGVEKSGAQPRIRGLLGCAYAKSGNTLAANGELSMLLADDRFGSALAKARLYANLGDRDEAFQWLDRACEERDSLVIWLKTDPSLADLHADPRFSKLLQEVGLSP